MLSGVSVLAVVLFACWATRFDSGRLGAVRNEVSLTVQELCGRVFLFVCCAEL